MTMVRTFDTDSRAASFGARVRSLLGFPRLVWLNRNMVANFLSRDLMGRFHGSLLGAWWMLVQPVFMFAVYFVVFGLLYRRGGEDPTQFALYMFSGVICFHALNEALTTGCSVVVANGNLVKKVAFPSEVLPIPAALVSLILYAIGAVVVVAIGAATGKFSPGVELVFAPVVLALQFLLTLGISLLLANANVFARDVQQIWRIFSTAWFFLSPVFWHPAMMRELIGDPTLTSLAFYANPAFSLLMAHRITLAGEIPELGITGLWGHIGVLAAWAFATLALGHLTFTANKHKHADIV